MCDGRTRRKKEEKIFEERMAENSPKFIFLNDIHIQEAQWTPSGMNSKSFANIHIIVTMLKVKDKDKILKAAIEKKACHLKVTPNKIKAYLAEIMESRRQWDDIFKVLKGKNCQPRILYTAHLSE